MLIPTQNVHGILTNCQVVASYPGSLLLHTQKVTFELPLAKLWGKEPGQTDHVSDVEGRQKVERT